MNLTVNSQRLATELRLLNKIAPTTSNIPILTHLRVEATKNEATDRLTFYATDLAVGLVSSCAADVREPGALAIPSAKFLALVEQFPDDDVQIAKEKSQVVVRCGKFTSRLQAQAVEDCPTPPVVTGETTILSGQALAQAIEKTRYAVKVGGPSYAIQGILLIVVSGAAALVATDGTRLALATLRQEDGMSDLRVVLPTKTVDVLAAHLSGGAVTLTVSEKHLFFQHADRLLLSRMINSQFPKYETFIPTNNDQRVIVDRYALSAALRRVNLVSDENHVVRVALEPGVLTLSAANAKVGSAEEALDVTYDGDPLTFGVSGDYLLDFLKTAIQQTVTLALKDAHTGLLLLDGDTSVGVIGLMRA